MKVEEPGRECQAFSFILEKKAQLFSMDRLRA